MHSHLTDAEIADITCPLKQGKARCKYIRENYGVLVKEKPNGQPLVGRAEFEAALLHRSRAGGLSPKGEAQIITPDWHALKGFRRTAAPT